MTMGGVAVKSLGVIVILLVTHTFPENDIQVWLSFSLLISLQYLADFGFAPSIARVIAYAFGGAKKLEDNQSKANTENLGKPNWELVGKIYVTLKKIYLRLNLIAFSGLITFGTALIFLPIQQMESPIEGWISWGIILFVSAFYIRGNIFFAYLEGVGMVAALRRWEMLFNLLRTLSSLTVLLLEGGILPLVAANQFWLLMNVVRNRYLSYKVYNGKLKEIKYQKYDDAIFQIIFSKSWKSAVGQLFTTGVTMLTALIYGTTGKTTAVVSYLFSLRVLQMIVEFASGPFYSQIPFYNMLMARKDFKTLIVKITKSMRLTYWFYTVLTITVGITLPYVLEFIDSNASFVSLELWALLILAFFGERYGAVNIQLYTTTNHVVWHITSIVTGSVFLVCLFSSYSFIGVWAFPFAFMASNYGFFAWYNARLIYKNFPIKFWSFEKTVAFPPFLFLITFLILVFA